MAREDVADARGGPIVVVIDTSPAQAEQEFEQRLTNVGGDEAVSRDRPRLGGAGGPRGGGLGPAPQGRV